MGGVQRDDRPGSEESGSGSEGEAVAAGQDQTDGGAGNGVPAREAPVGGPAEVVAPAQGTAPPPGPTGWEMPAVGVAGGAPPAPPYATAPAGQPAGVATTPPPPPGSPLPGSPPPGWAAYPPGSVAPPPGYAAPPAGYAAGPPGYAAPPAGYAAMPPPVPGQPYPPGPYPPAGPYPAAGAYPGAPYPAPSIGRTPPRGASWGAPAPTRTHRWGLGAYLLAEAVFLVTSALVGALVVGEAGPTAGALAVALGVPTVLAAATALLITWVRGNGPRIDLGLVWSWRDLGVGLAFGFGGLVLTIPASMVYVAVVGDDASSAVGDVFGGIRAGPALAVLVLVIVVFIAPMCEEILYRGLLWGGLERIGGRWVAFGVSTLLFAIAHFEFTRTPLLLVVAIPIAIARLYTGRLLASIVAHQINNLLPGIALVLGLLGVVPMA
ncbi:CPBP family intramembrane glutamic endopeptidase [Pseudonocardia sp. DLS-67]